MCLRFVARSVGPSTEPTKSPAKAVTERLFPFARASSASRTRAERLAPRARANSLSASSKSSGSLKETVRIGFAMVIRYLHKGITPTTTCQGSQGSLGRHLPREYPPHSNSDSLKPRATVAPSYRDAGDCPRRKRCWPAERRAVHARGPPGALARSENMSGTSVGASTRP